MDPTFHKTPVFPPDTCIDSERGRQRDVGVLGVLGELGVHDSSLLAIPPYWQHRSYESNTSVDVIRRPAIILEDHTENEPECSSPLWAKAVSLEDYVVVSGSFASVGDYIVWSCKIDTLDVGVAFLSLHCVLASPKWSPPLSVDPMIVDLGWVDNHPKEVHLLRLNRRRTWLNGDRYSEFQDLRRKLLITFPNAEAAMPPLPPKSVIRECSHQRVYLFDG